MACKGPLSDARAMYVDVKTDGSPPPSPRSAEAPLRPLAASSHDYGETPLAGSSSGVRSPTEKPLARLGRTALLVAVPAAVLLVAAAMLLAAVAGGGPGGQHFFGAPPDYDVLVVGAGAAGLAAAKQLREQGGLKVRLSGVSQLHATTLVTAVNGVCTVGTSAGRRNACAALRDPMVKRPQYTTTLYRSVCQHPLTGNLFIHRWVSRLAHKAK